MMINNRIVQIKINNNINKVHLNNNKVHLNNNKIHLNKVHINKIILKFKIIIKTALKR